jgi:hypothetical protein
VSASTGTGSGSLGVNLVDDDSITDGAGHKLGGTGAGNGNFTGQVYTLDRTAPTVSSINRADSNPTNASSVSWSVTFSEAVTGVGADDFALQNTGLGGTPAITGVSGSGDTYTVTASTGTGSGSLGLNLVDDDSIADGVGNKLGGSGAGNGNFTGEVYTINRFSYAFKGFFAPIETDNTLTPTILNKAQAGQAIPVKFSLTGYQGLDVFSGAATPDTTDDYPKSQQIYCDPSAAAMSIEETIVNPGNSSLTYAAGSDQYTFVWKTEKSWNNTCRQLVIKFKDGQTRRANFQFKK